MKTLRHKIQIQGIVQGVGFRPFVYRLARECHLGGFVNNNSNGVLIEVEGVEDRLLTFRSRLHREAPPLSKIIDCTIEVIQPERQNEFRIEQSHKTARSAVMIAPDISVCDDCLRELFSPEDRRHRYPFINCTNCGPRYTIVEGIPYDRPLTSMKIFSLCAACSEEYHDPGNRRFHAQPNACPDCGPKLRLLDNSGNVVTTDDPIEAAVSLLKSGKIGALRGIGGFHLAVDAHNSLAVRELRQRKGRAEKPFALMALDLAAVENYCTVSKTEAEVLSGPTRPIVLLRSKNTPTLAPEVVPRNRYLGFMLPYTPFHYLLLKDNFAALVMTSGNYSEEPIVIGNEEALARLKSLADFFLLHDREILQRCDDSVVRVAGSQLQFTRRSRGYVPTPVLLASATNKPILACGGELKNSIAISRDNAVFMSQHIGDLDNPATLDFFQNSIEHLQNILEIKPDFIAHDLHPEYLSTKWAIEQNELPTVAVQHHHAHLAAVMAENQIDATTIGLILDGTGYGIDGTIWGGEVLIGDFRSFERFAWLQPLPLPGGSAAIQQPWRMAVSALYHAYGEEIVELNLPFMAGLKQDRLNMILQMIDKQVNSPLTSSCGRLFDAISALLAIRTEINYEAQAAIELEMAIDESVRESYFNLVSAGKLHGALAVKSLIRCVVDDLQNNVPVGTISARFHRTLAEVFVQAAVAARSKCGVNRVGLSGGVFQNQYFFLHIKKLLAEEGFELLTHKQVPANDGGLALGQIVVANASIQ